MFKQVGRILSTASVETWHGHVPHGMYFTKHSCIAAFSNTEMNFEVKGEAANECVACHSPHKNMNCINSIKTKKENFLTFSKKKKIARKTKTDLLEETTSLLPPLKEIKKTSKLYILLLIIDY